MGPRWRRPSARHGGDRGRETGKGKEIRSDRLGTHVSGCGGLAVVSGLAGRVGPKGARWAAAW
jgi:hypothetical protein